jgi:hypothetical protein
MWDGTGDNEHATSERLLAMRKKLPPPQASSFKFKRRFCAE